MTDRTVAWFNCHAGVAGDMAMAALIDAGANADDVAQTIAGLGVDGYAIFFERVQRCGLGATWANVVTHSGDDHHSDHSHEHPHRPARVIFELLEAADLPERVRDRAVRVFRRLADVEGRIHGIDPDNVELHEVGALDSIIDVVGVCAALESLGVDEVTCSSIGLGSGMVTTAHGVLPHPVPATMRLLEEASAPSHGLPLTLETATPTGVALMVTLADRFGPPPRVASSTVGYGAGTADTPGRANVVQVVVGTGPNADALIDDGAPIVQLDVNVDDVTGEVLAHTVQILLDLGANDAWITPIVMKKGRPAHTVSALCDPSDVGTIRDALVRETGSLGVRASELRRWPQQREVTTVDIEGHEIGIKVGEHRVKVEFDDAARVATALDLPVRVVIERAIAASTHNADAEDGKTDRVRRPSSSVQSPPWVRSL